MSNDPIRTPSGRSQHGAMDKNPSTSAWRWLSNFTASAAGRIVADLIKAIFFEDS